VGSHGFILSSGSNILQAQVHKVPLGKLAFELDRAGDQLLQADVGISYRRFLFLTVLQYRGTVTQHELAVALGYSDPAVSTMLVELATDGYIQVTKSPEHARKHLVTITPKGNEVVAQGRRLLDARFDQLMQDAGVDAQHYHELTERIYQALIAKRKKEQL
jgi:DNA-binding MarR family transcriptional regulator